MPPKRKLPHVPTQQTDAKSSRTNAAANAGVKTRISNLGPAVLGIMANRLGALHPPTVERLRLASKEMRNTISSSTQNVWIAIRGMARALDAGVGPLFRWSLTAENPVIPTAGPYINESITISRSPGGGNYWVEVTGLGLAVSSANAPTLDKLLALMEQPSRLFQRGVVVHLGHVLSQRSGKVGIIANIYQAEFSRAVARNIHVRFMSAANQVSAVAYTEITTRLGGLSKRLAVVDRAHVPGKPDASSAANARENRNAGIGKHWYVFSCPWKTGAEGAEALARARCFVEHAVDLAEHLGDDEFPTVNSIRVSIDDTRDIRQLVVTAYSTTALSDTLIEALQDAVGEKLLGHIDSERRFREMCNIGWGQPEYPMINGSGLVFRRRG